MTNKTVLSDAALIERIALDEKFQGACQRYAHNNGSSHAIATAAIQAVLQSPEIQQMRKDAELLSVAVQMLADWCVAVKEGGTGWDYWDEHYKDAAYRDNPLRSLIDAAMEVKP